MPPQGQGIAALMMLNIMEKYPLGEWGFYDPRGLHVMIEAKKLAYADMLRYVGDPKFSTVRWHRCCPANMRRHARRCWT